MSKDAIVKSYSTLQCVKYDDNCHTNNMVYLPMDIVKIILLQINYTSCKISYKTLLNFAITNKHYNKHINSLIFNTNYGQIHGGNLLSFRKAINLSNDMCNLYYYYMNDISYITYNELILSIKLDKKYFWVYQKFKVNINELSTVIDYKKYNDYPFTFQLNIVKIKNGWNIFFGIDDNQQLSLANICSDIDMIIPLHYAIYNNLIIDPLSKCGNE